MHEVLVTLLPLFVLLAAPDGGTALLPPMPTDAQCQALAAPKAPFAFGPGEVLEYDLDAMGAKAGRMTMSVKPLKDTKLPVEVVVDWDRLEPGTDIHAIVRDQVASVTPLTWQMTAQTDWMPPVGTEEA